MTSKKVIIGTAATLGTVIIVDMIISTIKGKDLIKAAYVMTKICRYYQCRFVTDEELEEYELLDEKLKSFVESLNGKKSRSFNNEDRKNAHDFYQEVVCFYNSHCV